MRGIIFFLDGGIAEYGEVLEHNLLFRRRPAGWRNSDVYVEDGTVRALTGITEAKMLWDLSSLLYLNPQYRGKPMLSEPLRTYELDALKSRAIRVLKRWAPDIDSDRGRALRDAQDFLSFWELVPR